MANYLTKNNKGRVYLDSEFEGSFHHGGGGHGNESEAASPVVPSGNKMCTPVQLSFSFSCSPSH